MTYSHAVTDVRIGDHSCREQNHMGRFFQFVSGAGILLLAAIVIMAIIALTTGHFDPRYTNPPS
jgi:hypothetical protein